MLLSKLKTWLRPKDIIQNPAKHSEDDYLHFCATLKRWVNYKRGLEVVFLTSEQMPNKNTLGRSISPTPAKPGRIELRADLSTKPNVLGWVFCHEISHQLLHNYNYLSPHQSGSFYYFLTKEGASIREAEADSVASLVWEYFEFDLDFIKDYFYLTDKGVRETYRKALQSVTKTRVRWAADQIVQGYNFIKQMQEGEE